MRIYLAFIILGLFLINFHSVLGCQYTEIEKYSEDVKIFYHNGEKFGENLNLEELITFSIGGENSGEITITNNLDVPVTLNVTFHQFSKWYGFDNYVTSQINIGAEDHERMGGTWINSIDKYIFVEPNIITSDIVSVEKERQICRICSNGKQCSDDGELCQFDDECGYGECNALGICGPEEGLCSDGQKFNGQNCVNTLLTTLRNNVWWIILALIVIVYFWFFVKRNRFDKKLKELEVESKTKLGEIRHLEIKGEGISKINNEKEKLISIKNGELENLGKKQETLQEKIKHVSGELKRRTEKALRENKEKFAEINAFKNKIKREIEESKNLQNQREEIAIKRYCGKGRGIIKDGYVFWKNEGKTPKPYHTELYKKRFDIGQNQQVHHIDQNKLNNELWNLIAIDKDKHIGLHGNTKGMSWKESLNYLLQNNIIEKNNLHSEIKKKLKKKKKSEK